MDVEVRRYSHKVERPRSLDKTQCLIDIECVKVVAPPSWLYHKRFQVVMIGIGHWETKNQFDFVIMASANEVKLLRDITGAFGYYSVALFEATRDFDRNVLEGTWTNARRPMAKWPGAWPVVPRNTIAYRNVRDRVRSVPSLTRENDIQSVEVLEKWYTDRESVWKHNAFDMVDFARRASLTL